MMATAGEQARYTYPPPDAGVRIYSDDWKWGPDLKEVSDADCFVASRSADSSDRAPIRSQRHLVARWHG